MLIPITCSMRHTTHVEPGTALLADLAGGWHFLAACLICGRRAATRLYPTEAKQYEEAGVPVLEDSPSLRALLDTHAIREHGPLTTPVLDAAEGWLTDLEPLASDALIGVWIGQEALA